MLDTEAPGLNSDKLFFNIFVYHFYLAVTALLKYLDLVILQS